MPQDSLTMTPNVGNGDSYNWPATGEASVNNAYLAVDDNDTSYITGDTTNETITFDLSEGPYPSDMVSIDSVKFVVVANAGDVRDPNTVEIKLEALNDGSVRWTDTHTVTVNGGNGAEYSGQTVTTWNGSDAWTESKVQSLQVKLTLTNTDKDGNGSNGKAIVYYIAATLVYTIPDTTTTYTTDNHLITKEGILIFKEGITEIK